ncbi:unnamed protein product [Parascedosporium putredinis]|uniref:EthD domain-containing protein n=1 Tax=Parascedosporium putredinis TaxID=1442378 RepID=A0A9P1H868_9PEZI|nr:unnamed protein product [Parascedosporium putredinis]CAI8000628.1 unnamed protein product [Parascedosporium putredinis]
MTSSHPPARFTLLKRRPDLAREQYNEHWHGIHGSLLASLPDFRRAHHTYIQNHLCDAPASLAHKVAPNPTWDGFAQTFQNLHEGGAVVDFFDQPDFTNHVRPDEETFLDWAASTTTTPRSAWSRTVLGRASSRGFWGRVTRYTQYHAKPELFRGSSEMNKEDAFAGVAEIYFKSMEDLEAALADAEYVNVLGADGKNFVGAGSLVFFTEDWPMLVNGELPSKE